MTKTAISLVFLLWIFAPAAQAISYEGPTSARGEATATIIEMIDVDDYCADDRAECMPPRTACFQLEEDDTLTEIECDADEPAAAEEAPAIEGDQ